jgi:hypothetical protein
VRGLRSLPGSAAEWTVLAGRLSGLLLAFSEAEQRGVELPEPLGGRGALRAWARVTGQLRIALRGEPAALDRIDRADLDVLGDAARELGRQICLLELHGPAITPVAQILLDESAHHRIAPELLVAQLARAHGVLVTPEPEVVVEVWLAGEPG